MTLISEARLSARESERVAFFGFTAIVSFYTASGAPTPLYHVYQENMHLTALSVTLIFAIYVLGLLAALLIFGRLSDHLGRKPVILAALVANLVALCLFAVADRPETLLLARFIQGIATGAAVPALGAAILDTNHPQGAVLNSVSAFVGLLVGSLGAGLLVAFAPAPQQTVFVMLIALTALEILLLFAISESGRRRPGVLAALAPRLAIPAAVLPTMLRTAPVNLAAWALGGFYLSLMPSLVGTVIGFYSPLTGGAVVGVLMLVSMIAVIVSRNNRPSTVLTVGTASLVIGVMVTLLGLHAEALSLMICGTAIAGIGFGGNFAAILKLTLPLAPAADRAGLLAAYLVKSYLAFALPAIGAGLSVPIFGLAQTAYGYGIMVMALSAVSLLSTRGMRQPA